MHDVFVTYSWDNLEHQQKVISFTDFLRKNGYNAVMDKLLSQKQTAISFMKMMHQTVMKSHKVVIVLSEGYKQKAEAFKGGVGEEYSLILNDINENTAKYILVSFSKTRDNIVPTGLLSREVIILDNEAAAEKLFSKLSGVDEYEFSAVAPEKRKIQSKPISNFDLDSAEKKKAKRKKTKLLIEDGIYQLPDGDYEISISSSDFFSQRISKTFPGVRGLKIIDDPQLCVKKLLMLLKEPIIFGRQSPIWWFRGGSSMPITNVSKLSDTKILVNSEEWEIKRIAVYNCDLYYKSCMYVEILPDKPTGLCKVDKDDLNEINKLGDALREDYAIHNNRLITSEEYSDGAYEVDNEVYEIEHAEYRIRYLSPYNFVITGLTSSINSQPFDRQSKEIFRGILKNESTIDELMKMIYELPKYGYAPLHD